MTQIEVDTCFPHGGICLIYFLLLIAHAPLPPTHSTVLLLDSQKANVKSKIECPFGKLLLESPSNSQEEHRKLPHELLALHPVVMNLEQCSRRTGTAMRAPPEKEIHAVTDFERLLCTLPQILLIVPKKIII